MADNTRSSRGRPRSAGTDSVILAATCELLVENGYGRLSMEAVAARSGVGKPTLYRRWSSKAALVADAVVATLAADAPAAAMALPYTGEVDRDLRDWLDAFAGLATDPLKAALVLALTAAAAENPDDAEALHGLLTRPSHQLVSDRLRAAADAGQIRADADLDAIADALIGSVLIQLLTDRADTARKQAQSLLAILLRGLRPEPSA